MPAAPLTTLPGAPNLDQAPPLAIPASFFLLAPTSLIAAGVVVLIWGVSLQDRWPGPAFALAHLGTLGLLGATMMGALYQLIPVLGGTPVPAVRLAHGVHVLFLAGLAGLVARFLGAPAAVGSTGASLLAAAFLLFGVPVGIALVRAPARTWSITGMRVAASSLVAVILLGLTLALTPASALRSLWIQVHLTIGLCGWVGGLIAAVAWQLAPMFYVAPAVDRRVPMVVHGLQAAGVVASLVVLGLAEAGVAVGSGAAMVAAAPMAVAVWGIAPVALLRVLSQKKRGADGSIRFWFAALPVALCLGPLGVAAWALPDPRWAVAFGWVAVWGWAGTLVHGMLTRILPFLTWFHRYSPLLGKARVPAMRALYPDARVRIGLYLHGGTTLAGLLGIVSGVTAPAGVGLLITGAWLGWHLVAVLRHPVPHAEVRGFGVEGREA